MLNTGNYPALLLNADYIPVSIYPLKTVTWQESVRGIFLDKFVKVAEYDVEVSSPSWKFRLPSVVALKKYQKVSHTVPFTRTNIWLRDLGRCVYCDVGLTTSELTFDHVMPRSRAGLTSWENIVCACTRCNHRKANRTPRESLMFPLREPRKPTQYELAKAAKALGKLSPTPKDWMDFIYWDSELTN